MSEQILMVLKGRLDEFAGNADAETKRNTLKEELQYYILNFIYHHSEYNKWIMYGGSALRIIHGLDRMSVDLDFEVLEKITDELLENLKDEIGEHFKNVYGASPDFLAIKITAGRGLLLKFNVGKDLSLGNPSAQVHVKIDLNFFTAPKTVIERWPINHNQLSFVILTYNMSSLMASKIAAVFLRGTRGVGKAIYEEKGRDIYDLLWYMNKKAVPDFDYLVAKNIDVKDVRVLFDKLTVQMNKVNNENLKQDLSPLFLNRTYIDNWLSSWRESYLRLLDGYKIRTVSELENIRISRNLRDDSFHFTYIYKTEEEKSIWVDYSISDYWMEYEEGNLTIKIDKTLADKIIFDGGHINNKLNDKLKQYATLFYQKTENYFKKINRIMLGDVITTKTIRMTAGNFNQKEQIVLNKSALQSCELDDLLK